MVQLERQSIEAYFNIAKFLILFQDAVTNFSQQYVICISRGTPQGHDNKISKPSASFLITRTQCL